MRRAALALLLLAAPAAAQEREGYYYPPVGSTEVFDRDIADAPSADRTVRIGFVTQVTQQQHQMPYAPRWAVFAKGDDADEMIVVALDDAVFATLMRARAVMAQLSAPARGTAFFVEHGLADQATFYDMLKIMGFRALVLSDGRSWSHRIEFR